jgi:glycosyltransferase involved in cell wall biosynthesis
MKDTSEIKQLFDSLKVCVLVPTYNNDQTLHQVICEISLYTSNIIVVNDGSTDNTFNILQAFPHIELISYPHNRGKGHALKVGFRKAYTLGYKTAITIDSDGQHYASDLPLFIQAIAQLPHALIIGARNLNQEHVPGKSSFGNKFSNFWFWVETGKKLPDTQSGYRAYPLEQAGTMKYFSRKYELEIEAPVRIAWKGVPITYIPIQVYYPPAEERVTHFRPFKDFTRISILNTFLTFTALLYIHPRNFLKKLLTKEGWKEFYRLALQKPEESNIRKAASIGFGIFMGIVPVWGFQLLIGIPAAIAMKLNKGLFLIAANVSVFPITPIWWALSLLVGKWMLGYENWEFKITGINLEDCKEAGVAFFLGGSVLAIAMGLFAFLLSLLTLKRFRTG